MQPVGDLSEPLEAATRESGHGGTVAPEAVLARVPCAHSQPRPIQFSVIDPYAETYGTVTYAA